MPFNLIYISISCDLFENQSDGKWKEITLKWRKDFQQKLVRLSMMLQRMQSLAIPEWTCVESISAGPGESGRETESRVSMATKHISKEHP